MTTAQPKDGDGQSPEVKDQLEDDGERKPGLVIEVVLPDDKPELERDPRKQN